ncbi:MAG TPA: cupin-like domain-containing protein [Kofleriaceae bacterium]|nr:cupin-like domain-containing protein [Kofleriaceae bacterium]
MTVTEVETIDTISRDELAARDRPLRIAGGARAMAAVARWSPGYLADLLGDIELAWKQSATGKHPDFHAATLAEMFARGRGTPRELFVQLAGDHPERCVFTGDEEPLVQRRGGVTRMSPKLAALYRDVALPAQVPPDQLYTVWAWFSGRGAITWLHYDNNGCHNLNAQLTGEKTCALFSPHDLAALQPFPLGGGNPAYNCSRLDLDEVDPGVPRQVAHLEPGDLLFIPAWWLHAFHHHGAFNSNVNWWWKPAHAIDCPPARRQLLIDLATTAGIAPAVASPEAELLARLDAAAITGPSS